MKCGNASPIRLTAYQRGFLQVWSFYQIATLERSFYLNRRRGVNTILSLCESSSQRNGFGEGARSPRKQRYPKRVGPVFNRHHRCRLQPIADDRSPEIFGREKSRAWAKAWGAALAMAPTGVLASAAASPLPMLLQWGWLLAWGSQWRSRSALALGSRLRPQRY